MTRSRKGQEGRTPASGLRSQRVKVGLLVLLLFGVPLGLSISYLALRHAAFAPPFDEQPGGRIGGSVRDRAGQPLVGVRVELFLHPRERLPELFQSLQTDAGGGFRGEVPPLDGCYVVRVGGGPWVELVREITLVKDPFPELSFELKPGCELAVAFTRADGEPVRAGRFFLTRDSGPLGLPIPSAAIPGEFSGPRFVRGGLEPGRWTLAVELEDGTRAEWHLDLQAGTRELALTI